MHIQPQFFHGLPEITRRQQPGQSANRRPRIAADLAQASGGQQVVNFGIGWWFIIQADGMGAAVAFKQLAQR